MQLLTISCLFEDKTNIFVVTETETEEGLKPKEAEKHVLWLNRNIEDIEKQESSYTLSRFIGTITA